MNAYPDFKKTLSIAWKLLLGFGLIVFIVYVQGLVSSQSEQLDQTKSNLEMIKEENSILKQQMGSLKSDVEHVESIALAEEKQTKDAREEADKLNNDARDMIQENKSQMNQWEQKLGGIASRIDEQGERLEHLHNDAADWQKEYAAVLSSLDKKSRDLEDKMSALKEECLAKFSALNARMDRVKILVSEPGHAPKPIIIRKRNYDYGFEDVLPSEKSPQP